MDPVSLFSLVGLCGTITLRIARTIVDLCALKATFENISLSVDTLIIHTTALQAASKRLSSWLDSATNSGFITLEERVGLERSLIACEGLLFTLQQHIENTKKDSPRFGFLTKSRFAWNQSTIQEYESKLKNHIQALAFYLQVFQLPPQNDRLHCLDNGQDRTKLRKPFDESSSLFCHNDTDSLGSGQTTATAQTSNSRLSVMFDFDEEIVCSKAYRNTFASLMKQRSRQKPTSDQSATYPNSGYDQKYPSGSSSDGPTLSMYNKVVDTPNYTKPVVPSVVVDNSTSTKRDDGPDPHSQVNHLPTRATWVHVSAPSRLNSFDRDLTQALYSGDSRSVESVFMEAPPPVLPPGWFPWAYRVALDQQSPQILGLFLRHGFQISAVDGFGRTPLWYACSKGYGPVVEFLLEQGATVEVRNLLGETPLHAACLSSDCDGTIVDILLERGSDITARSCSGDTALHYACLWGNATIAVLLLNAGADPEAVNFSKETPLQYAICNAHTPALSLLLSVKSLAHATPKRNLLNRYLPLFIRTLVFEEERIKQLSSTTASFDHTLKESCERVRRLVSCGELLLELEPCLNSYLETYLRSSVLYSFALSGSRESYRPQPLRLLTGKGALRPARTAWKISPRELSDWLGRVSDKEFYSLMTGQTESTKSNSLLSECSTSFRVAPGPFQETQARGIRVDTSIQVDVDTVPVSGQTEGHLQMDGCLHKTSGESIAGQMPLRKALSPLEQSDLDARLYTAIFLQRYQEAQELLVLGASPSVLQGSLPRSPFDNFHVFTQRMSLRS